MNKKTKVFVKESVIKAPRTLYGYTWAEYRATVAYALLVTILGWIFIGYSFQRAPKSVSRPVSQTIPHVVEVEAAEPKCDDPISYIRCAGEKLGVPNEDIRTMIRIARCESSMNPRAKNRYSSASGLFQVIASTWYSNDCVGDKWDFKDSTDCAYKLYAKRGFQPWVSSRKCWME
jgi:hypothetical protein